MTPASAASAPNSLNVRGTYVVNADIHWASREIDVTTNVHVRNLTGHAVDGLTFNLLPLRLGQADNLAVLINGKPASFSRNDQSLIVNLASTLPDDGQADVRIEYRAFFNTNTSGSRYLFMKHDNIITAYRWIPWLSRAHPFDTPNFGESWVTATSPQVDVTLTSDVALKYATTGIGTGVSGNTKTYTATNVRDFNFSASPNYKVKQQTTNGVTVRIYYVNAAATSTWMNWTVQAIQRFTSKIGPYPYDNLSVAEITTGVGMESPGMTWIDSSLAKSRVPYIVVHETAHQWFYSAIGNDQATNPFLDEAMADFLTRDLLTDFRSSLCAEGRLDKSVYQYNGSCYNEVIYIQGGLYLRDYKQQVGADNFWNALAGLYQDLKFRIVGTQGFWEHMDAATGFNSSQHHDRFPSLF